MTSVLIVDDHPGFRAQARELLEAEGLTVAGEAADGEGAIRATMSLRPDVVLLDIGLPDVDGFTVAERIAGSDALDAAPAVILTSSRAASAYADRLRSSAAVAYLPKEDISGPAIRAALMAGR